MSAWQFGEMLAAPARVHMIYGPFAARVFMGPLVLGSMQLLLWFRFFAEERQGSRVFAAMVGCFMLSILLVTVLSEPLESSRGVRYFWVYAFVGVSHLAYAIAGRERRY